MSIQLGFQPEDFKMDTWRGVAAEFIATGLFVFLGVGSVVAATAVFRLEGGGGAAPPASVIVSIALAHGLAIALLVAATARISGGHINPAVSFVAALTGKMKVSRAGLYIAGQLLAAVFAVLLLKGIIAGPVEQGLGVHGISVFDPSVGGGLLDDSVASGAGAALLMEIVLTFALVFVIFATAMDPKGLTHLAPMAIGLAVLVDHLVGIPFTGASMNPARSFGPALVGNVWDDHWVYWLGPLIGAGLAGLIYEFVFMHREEEDSAVDDAV